MTSQYDITVHHASASLLRRPSGQIRLLTHYVNPVISIWLSRLSVLPSNLLQSAKDRFLFFVPSQCDKIMEGRIVLDQTHCSRVVGPPSIIHHAVEILDAQGCCLVFARTSRLRGGVHLVGGAAARGPSPSQTANSSIVVIRSFA
jgi:hypothetical protein